MQERLQRSHFTQVNVMENLHKFNCCSFKHMARPRHTLQIKAVWNKYFVAARENGVIIVGTDLNIKSNADVAKSIMQTTADANAIVCVCKYTKANDGSAYQKHRDWMILCVYQSIFGDFALMLRRVSVDSVELNAIQMEVLFDFELCHRCWWKHSKNWSIKTSFDKFALPTDAWNCNTQMVPWPIVNHTISPIITNQSLYN